MALGKYNRRTVSATSGAVVPDATVSFYDQLTGLPATAYNDPDGLDPIGSSTTSGSQGELEVFLVPGKYRITVEKDDLYQEITYEPVTGDIALVDADEVGLNFLALATPAANSIPRVLPNGFTELRTVAQTRSDLGLGGAALVNVGTTTGTVAAGDDSRLSDSREWTAATVEQAEAEAGVATTRRAWTAERVRQAIIAWWATVGTTVGKAMLNLTNPSAVRFIRINADNTVTARSDSEMRTDLGLGTAALGTITTTETDIVSGRLVKVGDYGLGSGLSLETGVNYDTKQVPAVYLIGTSGATNSPDPSVAFILEVFGGSVLIDNDRLFQRALTLDANAIAYTRHYNGSTWSSWRRNYAVGETAVAARTDLGLNVTVPAGPTASGEVGQTAGDASYIYRCIATDTWIRVPKDATWV